MCQFSSKSKRVGYENAILCPISRGMTPMLIPMMFRFIFKKRRPLRFDPTPGQPKVGSGGREILHFGDSYSNRLALWSFCDAQDILSPESHIPFQHGFYETIENRIHCRVRIYNSENVFFFIKYDQ